MRVTATSSLPIHRTAHHQPIPERIQQVDLAFAPALVEDARFHAGVASGGDLREEGFDIVHGDAAGGAGGGVAVVLGEVQFAAVPLQPHVEGEAG